MSPGSDAVGDGSAAAGSREIRAAAPRDLDRVAALFSRLLEHHAGAGPRFAIRPGAEDELRALLEPCLAAADARLLVWDAGGDLLGFCVARIASRPGFFVETRCGEIDHLFVREEARLGGLGRGLAEAALAWLRASGVGRVQISVHAANPEGRAFWRALGFEPAMDVLDRPL